MPKYKCIALQIGQGVGSNINVHIQAHVSELIVGNTFTVMFLLYIYILHLIDAHVLISAPSSFDVKDGIFFTNLRKIKDYPD